MPGLEIFLLFWAETEYGLYLGGLEPSLSMICSFLERLMSDGQGRGWRVEPD